MNFIVQSTTINALPPFKNFIIAKDVFYYKKFITKSKGERKNLSKIYKQQGKRQGWKKKT